MSELAGITLRYACAAGCLALGSVLIFDAIFGTIYRDLPPIRYGMVMMMAGVITILVGLSYVAS